MPIYQNEFSERREIQSISGDVEPDQKPLQMQTPPSLEVRGGNVASDLP